MVLSKPIHVESDPPPVDERLVVPETRHEIHDGELVHVPPADPPHAIQQSKVVALVEAHAGSDFQVADDMLTRTSRTNDFAPDVSVFPLAPDPRTGGLQLTQLAFEVVSTESLSHAGDKAAKLVARGVRRVFAIDVERSRMLEWSSSPAGWREIEAGSCIEDPVLAVPIPIELLIHAVKADDGMSRALLIKENPVLMAALDRRHGEGVVKGEQKGLAKGRREGLAEGRREGLAEGRREGLEEGRREGRTEGMAEGLLEVLAARGISLESADRARILGENDPGRFKRWLARAVCCTAIADMFAEP